MLYIPDIDFNFWHKSGFVVKLIFKFQSRLGQYKDVKISDVIFVLGGNAEDVEVLDIHFINSSYVHELMLKF